MNKLLVYGLWMLFSLPTAYAIWCYQCSKPIPTESCPMIQEFCWAGPGAGCYTNNLHIGSTMISSDVGCVQSCYPRRDDNPFMWYQNICCFTDYCNA